MIEPEYGHPIDRATLNKAIDLYEKQLILLHPFMPFITEEIWQSLPDHDGKLLMIESWPKK